MDRRGANKVTFNLTININKPEPDFETAVRIQIDQQTGMFSPNTPEADIQYMANENRNVWRLDQLSDFADVLQLVGNRIMRGEKSGKVRDLNGNNVGEFGVEL
jgi:hypothetical protein